MISNTLKTLLISHVAIQETEAEDPKFQVGLGCIVNCRSAYVTQRDPVSNNQPTCVHPGLMQKAFF
jgi:hypothetical protein